MTETYNVLTGGLTLNSRERCLPLETCYDSRYHREIEIVKTVFIREYGERDSLSGKMRSGTFDDLIPFLADFREKHIDTIILLPIHPLGKPLWGEVGSPYEPMDYFSIEPSLIKPHWGAGTKQLKDRYERFKKNNTSDEREAFRHFKSDARVLEYARYNAIKGIAQAKNRALNNFSDFDDEPEYQLLIEETLFEQFLAKRKFMAFIEHAHGLGLKVIMDMPAYFGTDSIADLFYEDYIRKNSDGTYYQPGFDQWGHGWYTLRQMDVNNPEALDYLRSIYRYWADTFNVDGFRVDAILTQPDLYVKAVREAVPHVFLLGETIGAFKGDIERKYIDELKLDSIYNPEWIWTGDIKNYLARAHERPSGRRLFHMRDTHDEGRLKKGDPFAVPEKKYLSVLAAALLGLPGQDIIGFLDGNYDLREGTPKLHELYLKEFFTAYGEGICFPDGTEVSTEAYIRQMAGLRKKLAPLKKSGNIIFLDQSSKEIMSFVRQGMTDYLFVLINVGNSCFSGSVQFPEEETFYRESDEQPCIDLISGKRIELTRQAGKGALLKLDVGQSLAFLCRPS